MLAERPPPASPPLDSVTFITYGHITEGVLPTTQPLRTRPLQQALCARTGTIRLSPGLAIMENQRIWRSRPRKAFGLVGPPPA